MIKEHEGNARENLVILHAFFIFLIKSFKELPIKITIDFFSTKIHAIN
jgi:hypothetical protein